STKKTDEEKANNGKSITLKGSGTLTLNNSIDQGAGGLFFEGDYEVKGISDNTTWKGAGISVAEGKTVKWKVHNPQSDRLAKIGKGKLIVEGKGNNQGSLKVGDGTVVLKQQTTKGQHAFASVGIVSGRSTVVLNDDNQVDPNSIYFGFRGGRLDLNGNSLTFDHIRNIDDGARLVNHNMTNASNITITGESLITNPNTITLYNIEVQDEDNPLRIRLIPYGKQLYFNQDNYTYYTLRKGASTRSEFPQNRGESNDSWLYMGTEKLDAQKNAMNHINNERMNGFNGYFGEEENKNKNGKLNVTFKGKTDQNRFLLTGGTNLNGDLNVEKGTLFLSGRPTPHARDIANISSTNKDPHFAENNEVVVEDDWINRTFKATNINVTNNATLYSGRNVESITSNITASNNAKVHIGYKAGDTVCVRSDYTGYVTCHNGTLSTKALNSFNATNVSGNVNLSDNANFTLGKASLFGTIQSKENSQVHLTENSHWYLTGNSDVHQLDLANGHIHLNNVSDATKETKYHTLNISNLSGNGSFYYWVDFTKNQGDKVVVTKSAKGTFTLQVANKTGEPNHNELTLFDASNATERSGLNVSLANGKVDRGAWSYTLKENSGRYYLHNPEVERRNQTVDTPSIATANNMQADVPSVSNNHEETARVEAPVPLPAPPAPATGSAMANEQPETRPAETVQPTMEDTNTTHPSGSEPQADTTQADDPNSESVPSETIEKVAENSPQESETVAKNEQKATETTAQNDEVAKEAKPTVEANTQTNELAQNGSETEETQEAETARQSEINSTEETVVEDDPTISEPKSRPRRSISSSSNNINLAGTEDTAKVETEKTQEAPQVASQASPKQEEPEMAKQQEQPKTVQSQAQPETTTQQAEPARENVSTVNNVKEAQPQAKPTTVAAKETTASNSEQKETAQPVANPKTAENKAENPQSTETTDENIHQPEAHTAVASTEVVTPENATTPIKPVENKTTEAEQPVTETTTVSTENPVVKNPENTTPATTQSTVNSEAVQSETATTEAVVSQSKVTSAEETTVASTQETTVDNSGSTPQPRSRRTRRSAQNSYEPVELPTENAENPQSGNDVATQLVLRDLTSTNTNAVLSDAMAKAQFVALNVGKAVSQHISQLEMNNEGQYNLWISNTSMNENYSSDQYRRFSSKSTQTQLGWDQTISNNVQLGGVFTYVRNSNSFDKASSKNTLAQANLYSKYYVDNHWYLAVDLGYGNFQSNLQTNHNAKFARHTAQFGLTAGKAFNLGNFGITPIVGVRYSYLSNADFALARDRIKVNPISVKTAFAQVDLSYTYHLGEFSVTPILSARYDANQGSGKINVNGYDFAYNVENQQQYNAGLKLKYHNVKLSLMGGLTKAKQAEKQKTAEVKLSFSF
ncbi:TPA: S6 family peptidase, partial [Haemophilus influenzae]